MIREKKNYFLFCDNYYECELSNGGWYWDEHQAKIDLTKRALSWNWNWQEVQVIQSRSVYHNDVEYFYVKKIFCPDCAPKMIEKELREREVLEKKGEVIVKI